MYRVSVFTLGTTLSPYISLHAYNTNTRARVRSFSFFLFFFFLSTLQLAAPLARLSFYSFRTRALAFTRTHVWFSHSRNERSYNNSCPVRPFLSFFSLLFFSTTIHHRVKSHSSRPAVAQQPSVANKMLYWQ